MKPDQVDSLKVGDLLKGKNTKYYDASYLKAAMYFGKGKWPEQVYIFPVVDTSGIPLSLRAADGNCIRFERSDLLDLFEVLQ